MPQAHNVKPWATPYCEHCGKALVPRELERKHIFAKRKFCNRECVQAARTAAARPKHLGPAHTEPAHAQQMESTRTCPACKVPLRRRRSETELQYAVRAYCGAPCFRLAHKQGLVDRAMKLGMNLQELL